jgi:hypothetical protein
VYLTDVLPTNMLISQFNQEQLDAFIAADFMNYINIDDFQPLLQRHMKIIGQPILMAKHVKRIDCKGPQNFEMCYPIGNLNVNNFYTETLESGIVDGVPYDWAEYKTAEEMGLLSRIIHGELSDYPNDGYYFTWVPRLTNVEQFQERFKAAEGAFFGNGVRAVSLKFTVYEEQIAMWTYIELLFEFSISD